MGISFSAQLISSGESPLTTVQTADTESPQFTALSAISNGAMRGDTVDVIRTLRLIGATRLAEGRFEWEPDHWTGTRGIRGTLHPRDARIAKHATLCNTTDRPAEQTCFSTAFSQWSQTNYSVPFTERTDV